MHPEPGTVLHFSEDPTITAFEPHVAATATDPTPYVWAVDALRSPDYWFPRDCPRAMAWVGPTTTEDDRRLILGPVATRVHLIENDWLPRFLSVELFAYRLAAADFVPYPSGPTSHALVARRPVVPLGPAVPVGDLLELHRDAGIELRCVDSIWPWWREVIISSLGFSGIRLANAGSVGGPGTRPRTDRT